MKAWQALDDAIVDFIRADPAQCDEMSFDALALQLFAGQYERNPIYRRFCDRRGQAPGRTTRWQDIPAVPTDAFKLVDFRSFPPEATVRTFVSSGTTQESRSQHHLDTLALYRASLLPNFTAHLLPDGIPIQMLSLTPPPQSRPESSLIFMIDQVMRELGGPGSGYFVTADGHLLAQELHTALQAAEGSGHPVLLLGAAFSFVHLLDRCAAAGWRFHLPPGSRAMETGGYKGRSREVPRAQLVALIEEHLAVPPSHCVNEYGMTELCVQFYDVNLADVTAGRPPRHVKSVPHWARLRILEPETLSPAKPGDVGLIRVCDLSNRPSCISLLTADLGRWVGAGFEVLGRAQGAEARGCSLTLDEILRRR